MLKSITGSAAAYAIVAAISFGTGWAVHGWKVDSENLAVERAARAIADKAMTRESGIAAKVEERLAELTANQTVIDRGVIREIQNPVYRNVCMLPTAVDMLNALARGEEYGGIQRSDGETVREADSKAP